MANTQQERLIELGLLPSDFGSASTEESEYTRYKDPDTIGNARIAEIDALETSHGQSGIAAENAKRLKANEKAGLNYGDKGYQKMLQATPGDRASLEAELMSFKNIEEGPSIYRGMDVGYTSFSDNEEAPVQKDTGDEFYTEPIEDRRYDKYGRRIFQNPEYADALIKKGLAVDYKSNNKTQAMEDVLEAKMKKIGAWGYAPELMEDKFKLRHGGYNTFGERTEDSTFIDSLQSNTAKLYGKIQEGVGEGLDWLGEKDREFLKREQARLDKNYPGEKVSAWRLGISDSIEKAGEYLSKRGEFIKANADEYYGYDQAGSKMVGKVWEKLKKGDAVGALGEISGSGVINLIADSVPEMLSYFNPVTLALTYTGNVAEAKKEAEKINRGKISDGRMAAILIGEAVAMSLEKWAIGKTLGEKELFAKTNELIGKLGNKMPKAINNAATKYVLDKAGRITAAAGAEAVTEVAQEGQRLVTTGLGQKDLLTEETADVLGQSAIGGGIAGGGIRTGREAFDTTKDIIKASKPALNVAGKLSSEQIAKLRELKKTREESKVEKEIADAENQEQAGISDFNDTKISEATEAIDNGDVQASFAAIKEIDESAYGNDEVSESKKAEINVLRVRVYNEIKKISQAAIEKGDDKAIESLGTSEDAKQNRNTLEDMLDATEADIDSDTINENIKKVAKKLDLSEVDMINAVNSSKAKKILRKSFNQVQDEIVNDPEIGYLAKYERLRIAVANNNDAEIQAGLKDMERFQSRQQSKSDELTSGLKEAQEHVEAEVKKLIDQKIASNREAALAYMISDKYKGRKFDVEYSSTGSIFEINTKDVAKEFLTPGSEKGIHKVLNAVDESVEAMQTLVNGLGLGKKKNKASEATKEDAEVVKSKSEIKKKTLRGILTDYANVAKKYTGQDLNKIADPIEAKQVSDYRKAKEQIDAIISRERVRAKAERAKLKEDAKKIIKEKAGKPDEYTKEEEQIIETAKDEGVLAEVNKELAEEVKSKSKPKDKTEDKAKESDAKIEPEQTLEEQFPDVGEPEYVDYEQNFEDTEASFEEFEVILEDTQFDQTDIATPEADTIADNIVDTKVKPTEGLGRLGILKNNLDLASQKVDSIMAKIAELYEARDKLKAKDQKLYDSIGLLNEKIKRASSKMVETVEAEKQKGILAGMSKTFRVLMNRLSKLLAALNFKKDAKVEEKRNLGDQLAALNQIIRKGYDELKQAKQDVKEVKAELEGTAYIDSIVGTREYDKDGKIIDTTNGTSIVAGVENVLVEGYKPQVISPVDIVKSNKSAKTRLSSVDLDQDPINSNFKRFTDKAVEIIEGFIAKPGQEYKDGKEIKGATNERLRTKDSLGRGLLFSKINGEIKTNKNVVAAIALSAEEYISYMGSKLSFNSPEDVARMLGIDENDVSAEAYEFWKNKGKFKKSIANQLGKHILSTLALTSQNDIDKEIYEKLISDLGNIAVLYMESKGYIENLEATKVSSADYKKVSGEVNEAGVEVNGKNLDVTIPMVKIKEGVRLDQIAARYKTIENDTGIEGNIKRPMTRQPEDKEFKIRRNDISEPTSETADTGNVLRKEEYTMSIDAVDSLIGIGKDKALSIMGYKTDAEIANMGYDNAQSAIARNRELLTSYDDLVQAQEGIKNGESSSMWFDWFISRNGRFMTDTGTIDPQNEKQLHRWLVIPKSSIIDIDMNIAEEKTMFNMAIAQAFGFDIDKKSSKSIQEFAEKILAIDIKEIEKVLESGEIEIDGTTLEAEHLGHTIQGIEAVKAYQASTDGKFETSLTVEFDAVTSGFILKMMQLPVLEMNTIKEWLAKGGVFVGGENGYKRLTDAKSMNDEIADHGIVDGYRTLAREMSEPGSEIDGDILSIWPELRKLLPTIKEVDESGEATVTSAGRALFKAPLMTFGYGAALGSIRRHLGYKMIEDLGTKLLDDSPESNAFIAKVFPNEKINSVKNKLKTQSIEDIKIKHKFGNALFEVELGKYLREVLIDEAYGRQLEDILVNNFQPMINANNTINNAFKMMFRAWKGEYDAKVAELDGVVTREQEDVIIKELREVFPLIKAPLSTDINSGVAIYTKKTASRPEYKYGSARTHTKNGQSTVQSMINEFDEAISAGAVIPIHYIDGSIMTQTLAPGGRLGVHDALVLNLKDAMKAVSEYNENTYHISKSYSMVSELLDSMRRVRKIIGAEKIKNIENIEVGKYVFTFDSIGTDLAKLEKEVSDARTELFSNDMKLMHMSAVEGTHYEAKGKKVKKAKVDTKLEAEENSNEAKVEGLGYGSQTAMNELGLDKQENGTMSELDKAMEAELNKIEQELCK